jgi:hypothetical protein
MTEKMMYKAPLVQVGRVCLEGVIADSYNPVIGTGDVKYTEYETVPGMQDGDILLF